MQKDAANVFTIELTFRLDEEAESAWAKRSELQKRFARYGSSVVHRVDEGLRFLYIGYLVEAESVLTASRVGLELAHDVFGGTHLNPQVRGFRASRGRYDSDDAEGW